MTKKHICKLCNKQVNYTKYPIQCDKCDEWYHGTCEKISKESWSLLGESDYNWFCQECTNKELPYWSLSEHELKACLYIIDEDLKVLTDKCMEFDDVTLNKQIFENDYEYDGIIQTSMSLSCHSKYVSHKQLYDIRNSVKKMLLNHTF